MGYYLLFQTGSKKFIFLVFFVSALHHGHCSISALYHVYCSVSVLHHVYCSSFLPCSFFTTYTVRHLDVLQYGSHMLSMYGVEMRWYHFSSVFSLCFFTTDSAGDDTLSHCCFPFLLSSSSSPCFISCFSHPDRHSDKLVVFRVFIFWAVPVFHSYLLDLLLQLTCCIHINLIFFSFSGCTLFSVPTSSSISSLF